MDERTQFKTALGLAKRALDYIGRYETPPTPHVFELFYTVCAGVKPELNEALAKVIADKRKVTAADAEHLYQEHLGGGMSTRQVEQVGMKLREEAASMLNVLGTAAESTSRYQSSLRSAEEEFCTATDRQSIEAMLQSLLEATQEMARANADLASNLVASQTQVEQLEQCLKLAREESSKDALTGLTNRKRFDILLNEAILYATSGDLPISLLIIDIDDFKAFNDRYGHMAGDSALRFIASCITANIKDHDVASRYGGEEFAIILPNVTGPDAAEAAERIRAAVQSRELIKKATGESMGRMSISAGVAELRADECAEALLNRADEALYAAKQAGRNTVWFDAEAGGGTAASDAA